MHCGFLGSTLPPRRSSPLPPRTLNDFPAPAAAFCDRIKPPPLSGGDRGAASARNSIANSWTHLCGVAAHPYSSVRAVENMTTEPTCGLELVGSILRMDPIRAETVEHTPQSVESIAEALYCRPLRNLFKQFLKRQSRGIPEWSAMVSFRFLRFLVAFLSAQASTT